MPLAPGRRSALPPAVINCRRRLAMYTVQSLWTQARKSWTSPRAALQPQVPDPAGELPTSGQPGRTPGDDGPGNPDLNDGMASMGVEAARADTADRFTDLLAASLDRKAVPDRTADLTAASLRTRIAQSEIRVLECGGSRRVGSSVDANGGRATCCHLGAAPAAQSYWRSMLAKAWHGS